MKQWKYLLIAMFWMIVLSGAQSYAGHVEYLKTNDYQVLKVPMDGTNKIVVPAVEARWWTPRSLEDLMKSVWGSHAINGAFFCPKTYSWCKWELADSTDKVRKSNGVLMSKWGVDVGQYDALFWFDENGQVAPLATQKRGEAYRKNGGWVNPEVDVIYNGISNPVLVKNGVNLAKENVELNNDAKQKKAWNKSFICSNLDNSLITMGFVNGQTFSSMADYIISHFQCYNAILLDNWGTKAMIYDARYVAGPGRNMMDAFVVIDTKIESSSFWSWEKKEESPEGLPRDEKGNNQKVQMIQGILNSVFREKGYSRDQIKVTLLSLEKSFEASLQNTPTSHQYYQSYRDILEAIRTYAY